MNRDAALKRLQENSETWDVVIIGGGASGLGCAVDAAARGYRTLLLERDDFAQGTSSRSTKLIHGGFRYLKQGHVPLVRESLRERGRLLKNAPHLVHRLSFVLPAYEWWEKSYYGLGLKVYDRLAGKQGLGATRFLSRAETEALIPNVAPLGLRGGVLYEDGQFDDARLAISLARTAIELGAAVINYVEVGAFVKKNGRVTGVRARDVESGNEFEIPARVVINATGVFGDDVRRLDEAQAPRMLSLSQGAHLVLAKKFLPGTAAIMIPRTDDDRLLFAIPWHGRVLLGTTDVMVSEASREPRPLEEEISFLLHHAKRYLADAPEPGDVLSAFAGLRPLVTSAAVKSSARLSRDHLISVSDSGLVTVGGGKWTTHRKMAEDAVSVAASVGALPERACPTARLALHGSETGVDVSTIGAVYGSERSAIKELLKENPGWEQPLHADLPYARWQVVWGARHEMARTVDDILSRRTRALILNARASREAAPSVAQELARELGKSERWVQDQVRAFDVISAGYLV